MRTALVTGGNRGIGLEVCRQLGRQGYRIVLTAREPRLGKRAASALEKEGIEVRSEQLDVSRDASVARCAKRLAADRVRVDVLVNNGAILQNKDVLRTPPKMMAESVNVNLLGVMRACQVWLPGMKRRGFGRIVNVSSAYASFADGLPGPAPYTISKAALNAYTLQLANAVKGDVKVNCCCPGWVRTRMGGKEGELSVEEGADTIVWLATLLESGPTGGFFAKRKPIAW